MTRGTLFVINYAKLHNLIVRTSQNLDGKTRARNASLFGFLTRSLPQTAGGKRHLEHIRVC